MSAGTSAAAGDAAGEKAALRARMRGVRRAHQAALPAAVRALVFSRPPRRIADLAPADAIVGIYHANGAEAPTIGYARWFAEHGRRIALPRFASRHAAMTYHLWDDPWAEDLLEPGPFGAPQPRAGSLPVVPALAIVPLLAFGGAGQRLGQGGGHYDRWHAAHPLTPAIGLAWDCQLIEDLPAQPHDHPLDAVVTPTRLYEF